MRPTTRPLARPPRAPRAPALLDARDLWVPGDDGGWRLRGASLAVWSGEVVCVAGADAAALAALVACLRGAPTCGGLVRARPGWWRLGRAVGPLDARGRAPAALARRLVLRAGRAVGGALVVALVIEDWAVLHAVAARAARHVPLRCVRLACGRIVPPPPAPRSVDSPPGAS